MTALGLYHDDHDLVASELGLDHLWDVSRFCRIVRSPNSEAMWHFIRIASFSTNVALVVFDCQEGKRVAMYHQVEKYIALVALKTRIVIGYSVVILHMTDI